MSRTNRRQFLVHTSKVLSGLAFVQATPRWAFANPVGGSDLVQRSIVTMGTEITISMPFRDFSNKRAEKGFDVLRDVNHRLSAHQETSQLSQLNAHPGIWQTDPLLHDVALAAMELGDRTEGALDVTVLPSMRRFGFIPGSFSDLDLIDYSKLEVKNGKTRFRTDGYAADFGGIAKGYAVDRAVKGITMSSTEAILIDAGGDIYAKGRPSSERKWKVGIRHPFRDSQLMATLEIENEAIATSGTYVQKRIVDGKEVSHIMDPRTGRSVHHVISATIVAPDTMTADALATATSVLGPKAGQALIASLQGIEGFWLYEDGSTFVTDGLKNRLTIF